MNGVFTQSGAEVDIRPAYWILSRQNGVQATVLPLMTGSASGMRTGTGL